MQITVDMPRYRQYSSHRGRQSYQLINLVLSPILCFYTTFLRHSYFFSLTWAMVGHSSALLLLSVLLHVHSLSLKVSDQVRAGTAPVQGRGTAQYTLRERGGLPAAYAQEWHFSGTPLGSGWLYWAWSSRCLQIKLTTGHQCYMVEDKTSHWQGLLHQNQ